MKKIGSANPVTNQTGVFQCAPCGRLKQRLAEKMNAFKNLHEEDTSNFYRREDRYVFLDEDSLKRMYNNDDIIEHIKKNAKWFFDSVKGVELYEVKV